MKTLKYIFSFALIFFMSCAEDDNDLSFIDKVEAPSEVSAVFKPILDEDTGNLGLISITPNAIGAASYNINFGDGTEMLAEVIQGESVVHQYAELPEEEFYDVIIEVPLD
ncbi:hypothetical protein [Thalassobellus suaedae]|uniref:PKD domain-containing protein n=1 Tax=Thalassobellus suaedae TaxID=3074124 RepID=A0ABY9XRZ2_9FLAO|nr:hypothetical protein RHP51_16500 [Flavobacteriaceae bacterium HL-DH14]